MRAGEKKRHVINTHSHIDAVNIGQNAHGQDRRVNSVQQQE